MNDLIDQALQLRADISSGKTLPTEDDVFIAYPRQRAAVGLQHGGSLLHASTQKLLKNDGSIDGSQIVRTVRAPDGQGNKGDR